MASDDEGEQRFAETFDDFTDEPISPFAASELRGHYTVSDQIANYRLWATGVLRQLKAA